jgi:hypothetical protein
VNDPRENHGANHVSSQQRSSATRPEPDQQQHAGQQLENSDRVDERRRLREPVATERGGLRAVIDELSNAEDDEHRRAGRSDQRER